MKDLPTTRLPPWMCRSCGYTADAVTPCDGQATPKECDIGICLNCGALQVLEGGVFRPLEARDLASLTPEERRELTMVQLAQRLGKPRLGDLTKGDGRA